MQPWVHNSLWEAAKVLLPSEVRGIGLTRPRCCLSGGILQSCRSPDSRGTWPLETACANGDALSLSLLHRHKALAAPPHARRASRQRQASPQCLGGGWEVSVLPLAS